MKKFDVVMFEFNDGDVEINRVFFSGDITKRKIAKKLGVKMYPGNLAVNITETGVELYNGINGEMIALMVPAK